MENRLFSSNVATTGLMFGKALFLYAYKTAVRDREIVYLKDRLPGVLKKICLLKELLPNDILQYHIIPVHETLCKQDLKNEIPGMIKKVLVLDHKPDPITKNDFVIQETKFEYPKRVFSNRNSFTKPNKHICKPRPQRTNQPRR